jgi:hypothetical protein
LASLPRQDSDKIAMVCGLCEAVAMRGIVLAVLAAAFFWAFDAFEYDGHHSNELWRQATTDGQYYSDQVRRQINRALSGH